MKRYLKKIVIGLLALLVVLGVGYTFTFAKKVPTFDEGFVKKHEGKVYNLNVKSNNVLKDNIKNLFHPYKDNNGGQIWNMMRYAMIGIVFLYFVLIGVRLLTSNPESEKDKIKQSLKSLYYIAIGALVFFGAIRLVQLLFPVGVKGTEEVVKHLQGDSQSLLFRVIILLKTLIFFIAIIMMTVYGFRIMSANDKAEEAKKHIRGVVNVVVGLVLIKIIDYVYYIAQTKYFTSEAGNTIISIAKILGYFVGAGAILMVFYAGYLLLTDQGKSENMKKAKNIFVNILLVVTVIFIFLLLMYQLFAEFA